MEFNLGPWAQPVFDLRGHGPFAVSSPPPARPPRSTTRRCRPRSVTKVPVLHRGQDRSPGGGGLFQAHDSAGRGDRRLRPILPQPARPLPLTMGKATPRSWRWLAAVLLSAAAFLALAFVAFQGDVMRWSLDPGRPSRPTLPPPAPDYAQRKAWFLLPADRELAGQGGPGADIFFVSPTTFEGGKEWNGPIDDPKADRVFRRVMAPNYAGPFVRVGPEFAPRYRRGGFYSPAHPARRRQGRPAVRLWRCAGGVSLLARPRRRDAAVRAWVGVELAGTPRRGFGGGRDPPRTRNSAHGWPGPI